MCSLKIAVAKEYLLCFEYLTEVMYREQKEGIKEIIVDLKNKHIENFISINDGVRIKDVQSPIFYLLLMSIELKLKSMITKEDISNNKYKKLEKSHSLEFLFNHINEHDKYKIEEIINNKFFDLNIRKILSNFDDDFFHLIRSGENEIFKINYDLFYILLEYKTQIINGISKKDSFLSFFRAYTILIYIFGNEKYFNFKNFIDITLPSYSIFTYCIECLLKEILYDESYNPKNYSYNKSEENDFKSHRPETIINSINKRDSDFENKFFNYFEKNFLKQNKIKNDYILKYEKENKNIHNDKNALLNLSNGREIKKSLERLYFKDPPYYISLRYYDTNINQEKYREELENRLFEFNISKKVLYLLYKFVEDKQYLK